MDGWAVFFFGREKHFLWREKSSIFLIFAREKKLRPWKIPKNPSKVRVKITFWPWKFLKITPVKIKLVHVKNNRKKPRQKGWKSENVARETVFFAREKKWKSAREKKLCAWKNLKKPKKVRVKMKFCPWKERKIGKKRLSRPLFFSRPKKKHCRQVR